MNLKVGIYGMNYKPEGIKNQPPIESEFWRRGLPSRPSVASRREVLMANPMSLKFISSRGLIDQTLKRKQKNEFLTYKKRWQYHSFFILLSRVFSSLVNACSE